MSYGYLKVTSIPMAAMVYLDGVYKGYTSEDTLAIGFSPDEDHLVRLVKYGYNVCSDTVSATGGQIIKRHYNLIPEDSTGVK